MAPQVDVYDGTAEYLRALQLDQDSLTKAIIGTIGDIDSYQLPDAKGYTAFMRHLLRVSDEERQARREQILGTTIKDFRCWPAPACPFPPRSPCECMYGGPACPGNPPLPAGSCRTQRAPAAGGLLYMHACLLRKWRGICQMHCH